MLQAFERLEARGLIEAAGYGAAFVHRTGHSIDRDLHGSGPHLDDFETHDDRLLGRAWTDAEHHGPIRHAFEIRHPGFLSERFIALLRTHDAALVFADTAGRWPYAEDLTADFVYVRLHGAEQLYASGYTDPQLDWWAARIREWRMGCAPGDATCVVPPAPDRAAGRDVHVYFDNDAKVHAPFDAIRLAERLA